MRCDSIQYLLSLLSSQYSIITLSFFLCCQSTGRGPLHSILESCNYLISKMSSKAERTSIPSSEVPSSTSTTGSCQPEIEGGTGCAKSPNASISDPISPSSLDLQPRIAFISGPLSPSPVYFATHYAPRILSAISAGDSFILGPSRGIYTIALDFLLAQNILTSRVKFYMFESEAYKQGPRVERLRRMGVKVCVRGKSHMQRDAAMTRESDYDILKYLTREECMELYGDKYRERIGGTELNERRRAAMKR